MGRHEQGKPEKPNVRARWVAQEVTWMDARLWALRSNTCTGLGGRAYSLTLRRLEGTKITSWQSSTSGVHAFAQSLSRRRSSSCLTTTISTPGQDATGDCGRLQAVSTCETEKGFKAAGMVMVKMSKCSFKSPCGKLVGVVHGDQGPRSLLDAVRKSTKAL